VRLKLEASAKQRSSAIFEIDGVSFKREFGYSPSEARYAALSGLELGVTPKTRAPSAGADFGELLRRF
jgi:hypothetical protein